MTRQPASVIWFEIWVSDLDRAEAFYGPLMGWTFRPFEEYDPENYHLVSMPTDALGGALVRIRSSARPAVGDGPRTVVYAAVHDLNVAVAQARTLGAAIVQEPCEIGSVDGWFAMVEDPDGNRLGLWSQTFAVADAG
jgi:predicted enzyme related to lactoylglutathione lyase